MTRPVFPRAAFVLALLLSAVLPAAWAEGKGPGVGMEALVSDAATVAPTFVYDFGALRLNALFGFRDTNNTRLDLAGRVYYAIHQGDSADFALGGGLELIHTANPDPFDDTTALALQAGAQIRAFVTGNVAVHGTLGLVVGMMDANGVAFTGQPTGGLGLTYFF